MSSATNLPVASDDAPTRSSGPRARVMHHVQEQISSGVLSYGEVMPPVAQLAEQLSVNWRTASSALDELEEQGLIARSGNVRRVNVTAQGVLTGEAQRSALQPLLQSTVVVMTGNPFGPEKTFPQPGWASFVDWGVRRALDGFGLHSLAFHRDRVFAQWKHIEALPMRGIIVTDLFVGQGGPQIYERLSVMQDGGVNVVVCEDEAVCQPFARVDSDHVAGAYKLTRFLIESGRQRLLMIGDANSDRHWFVKRRAGHERALREANIEALPVLRVPMLFGGADNPIRETAQFEAETRHMAGYLAPFLSGQTPVDAIMCVSDAMVAVTIAACRALGRAPHGDVAVVGYDNFWQGAGAWEWERTPPLATIDKNNERIGQTAAEIFEARASGRAEQTPSIQLIEPTLVVP